MKKTISAIALLAGLAAAVPAFAQSPDPAANAVSGGVGGAGTGALIGCLVTIPIGCAPGAAIGAAVGGGVGATAGVATTRPTDGRSQRAGPGLPGPVFVSPLLHPRAGRGLFLKCSCIRDLGAGLRRCSADFPERLRAA